MGLVYEMRIKLLPILFVLCNLLSAASGESVCKLPNTGTVLFRSVDVDRRHCWSCEELALVYTRRVMMELIPRQIPHNIPLILEYVNMCLTTLRETASSDDVYDYMLAAFADTFGGYLQTYGLPLLREAYYEGYVSYDTAAEFHRLQDSLKGILMTSGEGWSGAMEVRKHINRILPLKMPSATTSKPCGILLSEGPGPTGDSDDETNSTVQTKSQIPLPILDDNKHPNSIAIPFKSRALFSLKSRSSYDILIKYYIEAARCISQSSFKDEEQTDFDQAFLTWLRTKVLPHLKDEDWYVGFSNVLRIEETIQQRGGIISASRKDDNPENSLFSELESETQFTKPAYIILLIILLLSLIFICFLYWALIKSCCMCCGKAGGEKSGRSSSETDLEGSDQSALLKSNSSDSDRCTHSTARDMKRKGQKSREDHPSHDEDLNYTNSSQTPSDQSRLTMSCGLGRGFSCHRHHKH